MHINEPLNKLEQRIQIDVNKCKHCDIFVNDIDNHIKEAHTQWIKSKADYAQTEKILNMKRQPKSESGPEICKICDCELMNLNYVKTLMSSILCSEILTEIHKCIVCMNIV